MMTDPEDANYKCTLTESSLKKAITELNEDPKQRLGAVHTLRKWIRDQPHFTCRTDTKFLLNILRRAKFSQLIARGLIENILTHRTKYPELTVNLDLTEPGVMAFIDVGSILYIPRKDKEGRQIVILRAGKQDVSSPLFSLKNEMRALLALSELYRDEDENLAVNGYLLAMDFSGAGMKYINKSSMEQRKISAMIYQDGQPERMKALLFYNVGTILEIMMTIVKTMLKKKIQERVHVHDNMESMYKMIPMEMWPNEYLPDDYKGPSAGSIDSIIADMKKRMMNAETRNRILANTSDKYKIDATKRPSDAIPSESFRKLNVD